MRIIDIIKILGTQTLPFRGHRYELAYTLDNEVLDRGNCLATGGLDTHVSKTNINILIQIMKEERISQRVSKVKYYSVQVDRTQDNSPIDQFNIVTRHVLKGFICERLRSVVTSNNGTEHGLLTDLLTETLHHLRIDRVYLTEQMALRELPWPVSFAMVYRVQLLM